MSEKPKNPINPNEFVQQYKLQEAIQGLRTAGVKGGESIKDEALRPPTINEQSTVVRQEKAVIDDKIKTH